MQNDNNGAAIQRPTTTPTAPALKSVAGGKGPTGDKMSEKVGKWKDGKAWVRLSKPIETANGQVHKVELQEPDAGFMMDHGLPYNQEINTVSKTIIYHNIPDKMLDYLVHMSGLDVIELRQLKMFELNICFELITRVIEAGELGN